MDEHLLSGATSACRRRRASIKPTDAPRRDLGTTFSERPMFGPATIAIAIFVLVIAVLNRVEFGRFD